MWLLCAYRSVATTDEGGGCFCIVWVSRAVLRLRQPPWWEDSAACAPVSVIISPTPKTPDPLTPRTPLTPQQLVGGGRLTPRSSSHSPAGALLEEVTPRSPKVAMLQHPSGLPPVSASSPAEVNLQELTNFVRDTRSKPSSSTTIYRANPSRPPTHVMLCIAVVSEFGPLFWRSVPSTRSGSSFLRGKFSYEHDAGRSR